MLRGKAALVGLVALQTHLTGLICNAQILSRDNIQYH